MKRAAVLAAVLVAAVAPVVAVPAHAAAPVGKPTISKVDPASGSYEGGRLVTITGTNFLHVRSVTFGGMTAQRHRYQSTRRKLLVYAPRNDIGWSGVTVTTDSGTTTKPHAYLYTPPPTIDPPRDAPTSLSCPAGHCYGMDGFGNFLDAGPGSRTWFDHGPPELGVPAATQAIECSTSDECSSISCPHKGFCASVDDQGRPLIWSNGVWKHYKALPPLGTTPFRYPRFVSCGSRTFCVVSDEFGDYSIWHGRVWSRLRSVRNQLITKPSDISTAKPSIETLSCAGESCLMIDDQGWQRKLTAGGWTRGDELHRPAGFLFYFNQVSCANTSAQRTRLLCVAGLVDQNHTYLIRFAGGRWHRSDAEVMPYSQLASVSCSTGGKCIAVRNGATTYEYGATGARPDKHGWTGPIAGPDLGSRTVRATSCQGYTTCTASISGGYAATFNRTARTWSTLRRIVVPRLGLSAIGCTEQSLDTGLFCLAGDIGPAVVDYVGTGWRKPVAEFRADDRTVAVSCVDKHPFCIALSKGGQYLTDTDGTMKLGTMPTDTYVSISCWSVTGCYAVSATNLYQWDGTTWSGPTDLVARGSSSVVDVACASGDPTCLAVTADGTSFTIDGSTTSAPQPVGAGIHVTADSCGSSTDCSAITPGGEVYHYDGTVWKKLPTQDTPAPLSDVACVPDGDCVSVGPAAHEVGSTADYWRSDDVNRHYRPDETGVACASLLTCFSVNDVGELRRTSP